MNKLTRYATVMGLCWIAATISLQAQDANEAKSAAIEKAREETIRRQELVIRAEKMVKDADQLAKNKKYSDAAAACEQVLKFLPKSPATEKLYQTAQHGAVDNRLRAANVALHDKNAAGARADASKVLAYDPNNSEAKSIIAKADRIGKGPEPVVAQPAIGRPDRAPDVLAKEERVKRLIREGRIWFESGKYNEAELKLRQALALDEYNTEAMRLLKRVHQEQQRTDLIEAQTTYEHRFRETTQMWNPPPKRDVTLPVVDASQTSVSIREKVSIEQKMNKIVLPEVKFDGARIDSVVAFLVEESRRLDPEKRGINIVLKLSDSVGGGFSQPGNFPAPPTPTPEAPFPSIPGAVEAPPAPTPFSTAPAAAPPTAASSFPPITLNLRDIPLYDVLKLVTDLAGLKFRIDRKSVVIVPLSAPPEGIVTRVYPIQPGVFRTLVDIPEAGGGEGLSPLGSGSRRSEREDVKKFFSEAGVPFPAGTSISYSDRLSLLIVSNTPENLELFERVISQLNVIPSQVEIEAKFIEVTQQNVNELGFKWNMGAYTFGGDKNQSYKAEGGSQNFPPGALGSGSTGSDNITRGLRDVSTVLSANAIDSLLSSGSSLVPGATELFALSGVLTDPQFQVVLRALAVQRNADLLSAPKVTTVSGNTAQIKIVREFRYPTEFTAPVIAAGVANTGGSVQPLVTPSTPGSFETREVGVLLNVTPTVGPDGYTINLTLVPEVSDFDGFIDYGGSIASGNFIVPAPILQPVFSSRQVTTTIQIWDGQTVVLGGLIREDIVKINDKVPFLGDIPLIGRLFRSKAETNVKRNLLIFVTANLIDPAGNRIHKNEAFTPPVPPAAPATDDAGGG